MMVRSINILSIHRENTSTEHSSTCLDDEDINERRKQTETSNTVIIPSSVSSPMRTIPQYPDIQFFANTDFKAIPNDMKDEEKYLTEPRRSNHTFTPPTSSLSPHSSSNDLHLTSSSLSVDLPQLKYAIEKFLLDDDDDDDPIYQFVDEFPPGSSFHHQGKTIHRPHSLPFNLFQNLMKILLILR